MPTSNSAASALAQPMQGTSADEFIPELMRQAFQDLIDHEVASALGAERHECSDSRLGYCNGHLPPRVLTLGMPETCSGEWVGRAVLSGGSGMGWIDLRG